MNDFSFMKKMNEEDAYLFKRCIRKMLDTTFIVADKDEKLYEFISSESNQYDVNTYLDVETVGLKRTNLYRFDSKQIKLLMALWLLFLERVGYSQRVYVTVGDIIDKCQIYQIYMKPAEFKEAYRIFKRFSLIDYSDDIASEEGKVRLYPSLQFCMDIGQLKQVMAEYAPEGEMAETEQDGFWASEDADE